MFWVNIREALRSLLASKQRTLLALLGVVIGIGSVMAMLTIGASIKEEALRQFKQMGTDVLTLKPLIGPAQDSPESVFSLALAQRLAKYSRHILLVSPEKEVYGQLGSRGKSVSASILGVRSAYAVIKRLRPARGRLLTFLDQGRPHAVVGAELARLLERASPGARLDRVEVEGRPFVVVGILAPAQLGLDSRQVDSALLVPLDVAARMNPQPALSSVTVKLRPQSDHKQAQREIKYLAQRFGLPGDAFHIESPRQILEQMEKQMGLYTLLLAAVGSISLVVGGVGIMNMLLVSVTERRREIGIRRALGARRRDITSQFLVESVILSLGGGVIGIILGGVVGYVVAQVQAVPLVVTPQAALGCLGVAAMVGLVFGYYPARKAAAMDVILALRSE